jgi:hypothetical protein
MFVIEGKKESVTMEYEHIKVPYGWCSVYNKACPDMNVTGCRVEDKYFDCVNFRKSGEQNGIAETDYHGQRRIYLALVQGVYIDPKTQKPVCIDSPSEAIRDNRGCQSTIGTNGDGPGA